MCARQHRFYPLHILASLQPTQNLSITGALDPQLIRGSLFVPYTVARDFQVVYSSASSNWGTHDCTRNSAFFCNIRDRIEGLTCSQTSRASNACVAPVAALRSTSALVDITLARNDTLASRQRAYRAAKPEQHTLLSLPGMVILTRFDTPVLKYSFAFTALANAL